MFDKEHAKVKLQELIDQFSQANLNKEWIHSQNEEWVKHNYIEPLLYDVLGWSRGDIEKEARVLKGRADYILKIGNEEVLVIEAKRVGALLSDEEAKQAVSYAYHRKIKLAIVTNFKEIRVYHALSNIKNIDNNLLKLEHNLPFRLPFAQFLEKFDTLSLLSKESFETKAIGKLVPTKLERASKPIDESILADLLQFRDWLSKDLKKTRMHLTKEQIDEVVQIFIDRLIFMRSVEDRGLEPRNFLLGLCDNVKLGRTDKNLWASLKDTFKTFDKTYNSKLFAEGLLEKEGFFDEQTLVKVLKGLYFGTKDLQARYMFDEIPGDLLGTIYEQYLGTILQDTEKRVKLEEESGKRKKMGIYYTPSYIVDYIVKNTVGEYIKHKAIDEILEINIVDPACGSGSFLIRAFQEVCSAIEDRLKKGERGKMATFQSYKERLSFGQKISILTQCIYGVDLDEKAVELAQLNLLLKLLEDESPESHKRLLPNLRENIKCGNSLIDDPAVAGDKAFKWEAQFPEVFRDGGFDVVVGNPPWGAKLGTNNFEKIYQKLNLNSFSLFVYKGLELISKKGLLGYIIPKNFIRTNDYTTARKRILEKYSLLSLTDTGQFPGVVQEAVVIILSNKKSDNNIKRYLLNKEGLFENESLDEKEISKKPDFIFDISSNREMREIIDKISRGSVALGSLIVLSRGIETGKTGRITLCQKCKNWIATPRKEELKKCSHCKTLVKISHENTKNMVSKQKDKEHSIPVIAGNKVERYKIKELSYLVPNLPGINYKTKDFFQSDKIVIVRILPKIVASFDNDGCYTLKTVYNLNLLSKSKTPSLKYILGILNSKLISFYYEYTYNLGGNLTPSLSQENIKRFPIRIPTIQEGEKLVDLVDQMLSLQKKCHEDNLSGNEKERLEQQIKNLDYEIDQEVYNLYGITKEEQKIIEESLK